MRSRSSESTKRSSVPHFLGDLLGVTGLLLLLPLVLLVFPPLPREDVSPLVFLGPAALVLGTGLALKTLFPRGTPSLKEAMVITGLGWLFISAAGCLPFVFGLHKGFLDALFESVSGFTTTGITVFEGLDRMPASILFWRSLIQWLGGLGILTFFLAVSVGGGGAAASLFGAEGHKVDLPRPVPGIFHTVKILWGIYALFTAACFLAFLAGGMPPFDALNHSLTCLSTGGFSTHDESMAFFGAHNFPNAVFLEYAASFFMLLGGMNFLLHYKVLSGRPGELFRDFEARRFFLILAGATLVLAGDHLLHFSSQARFSPAHLEKTFRISLFQASSLITSTGFATKDINSPFFPALSKQVFFLLMIVGGCVGSTAGGIKVFRAGVLARLFRTRLSKITTPWGAVGPVVVNGKVLPEGEILRISAIVFAWLGLIAAGGAITAAFSDLDAWQSFSGMASAAGNMGPFYFSVHKMAGLSPIIKITYIFGMLAGRLEILPVAVLFTRAAWRR